MPPTDEDTERARGGGAQRSLYGDELAPGVLAGEYHILATIAAGGCGTVYAAEHRVLLRRVAVKVLHRDLVESPVMLERFVREAQAVNRIRHPHIVDIYDFGSLPDGRPFYVMELLEGSSLHALITAHGRLAPEDALDLFEPLCDALHAAHEAGIIHRDVKAANVMIATAGGRRIVKLVDFGVAKLLHPEPGKSGLTSAGRQVGTPHAMAPEQIRGLEVDGRTDVYALGVLLYHLLTGRFPFEGGERADIERLHLEAPRPRPSDVAPVSAAVDEVVVRAMAIDPGGRWPTPRALLVALRRALGGGADEGARESAAGRRRGIAIYVEARLAVGEEEAVVVGELEALAGDAAVVLDAARLALAVAGFGVALQTDSAVLGARACPEGEAAGLADRRRALAAAVALGDHLAKRPAADARLEVVIAVHTGEVETGPTAVDVTGGPLLDFSIWIPPGGGVWASEAAAAGLELDEARVRRLSV